MNQNRLPYVPRLFNDAALLEQQRDAAGFHFADYANALAHAIASGVTETPLAIGVVGKWGSGKTSLMRLVKGRLDQADMPSENFVPCKTVWFDAWKYAEEGPLYLALVRQIWNEMKKEEGFLDNVKGNLPDPLKPRLKLFELGVDWFSQIASAGQVEFDMTKFEQSHRLAGQLSYYDEFQTLFHQLLEFYIGRAGKDAHLVVFIDDLDRCLPSKVVQVLEAVKLLLDHPGCVFVLGADDAAIAAAVEAHYHKENLGTIAGERYGERYLDKILQVRFPIPAPRLLEVDDFVMSLSGIEKSTREYLSIITHGIETNPRRIKTFLNHLEVHWALISTENGAEKGQLAQWLVLNDVDTHFCDAVRAIENDADKVSMIAKMKEIATAKNQAHENLEELLSQNEGLRPYANNPRLVQLLAGKGFEFKVETIGLYVHLSPPPPLQAEPEPVPPPTMTREEVEAAVREGRSLAGANLQNADLGNADLQLANLQDADLRDANLQRANLRGAYLQRAYLQRAHLRGAYLQRAHLRDANLRDANLRDADLGGADLRLANLWGADLRDAYLRRANLQRANLWGADLRDANLGGADLRDANLQDANLWGANLWGANLQGTDLRDARFDPRTIDLSETIGWRDALWDEEVRKILEARFPEKPGEMDRKPRQGGQPPSTS